MERQQAIFQSRSERAEQRAAITLGAAGVLVGLAVGAASIVNQVELEGRWLMVGLLTSSLILILKAALYSLRALDALRGNELSPDTGFELAAMSEEAAMREELVAKTWELLQLRPIVNARLYYSQRGQKNLAFAIGMLALTGALLLTVSQGLISIVGPWEMIGVVAALLGAVVLDAVHEKAEGLWKSEE